VNVTFARATGDGFDAVVHERGVGVTKACGSGACAVGVAAIERGLWSAGRPMIVRLPGGPLMIEVDADGQIHQEGEAIRVFVGQMELT
jgi:diaminopimelate epimerase